MRAMQSTSVQTAPYINSSLRIFLINLHNVLYIVVRCITRSMYAIDQYGISATRRSTTWSQQLLRVRQRKNHRQGLAVLMASTVVVLKHEISTLRQSHTFISIDLTYGVSDYVIGRLSALPNLVRIRWAVETPRGRNIYESCDFLIVFLFFCSLTELRPIPMNQFSRAIAQKTRSGVRKTLLGIRNV